MLRLLTNAGDIAHTCLGHSSLRRVKALRLIKQRLVKRACLRHGNLIRSLVRGLADFKVIEIAVLVVLNRPELASLLNMHSIAVSCGAAGYTAVEDILIDLDGIQITRHAVDEGYRSKDRKRQAAGAL
ncbi:hypothetical protein IQ22_01943 [Pseudomonas duriflava]|uniref:Uncharacterized protein n=1 Tax=Pseudomonas duriflava TaxID=459528 RepID=A0A562QE74_9PSED|nr:hypothetical protein [Pseudomonas duriflava]TWI55031.1 hypothetical protein IQ22_01943 [Pseudomonas duriflava]